MEDLRKISETEFEIPKSKDMNVPARIFATQEFIDSISEDKSLEQVANIAKLPGILKSSLAMPDIHQGYGFPIGGVAAFDMETGVISPGGVGYDINCSVRLLKTNLTKKDLQGKEKQLAKSLFKAIPTGVGVKSKIKLSVKELDEILVNGVNWAIKNGYGKKEDSKFIEENGQMSGANSKLVSQKAKGRGLNQLGTLGAGNHFVDILSVEEIFSVKVAKAYGLEKDQIVILIHCGSRGLGHQVASDYIKLMEEEYGFPKFDRELVNAPINSKLGKDYLSAMAAASNFAFANKQVLTGSIENSMKEYFPNLKLDMIYDICHNIAKVEKHDGKDVLVIRKGATRSLGPNSQGVPEDYKSVGAPVIIPGSMGTRSFVMAGTNEAKEKSFSSAAHGAGRSLSRKESTKKITTEVAKKQMQESEVVVEAGSNKGIVEEFPHSYKNIDDVVKITHKAKLAKKVASLKPLIVIIG